MEKEAEKWLQNMYIYKQIPGNNNSLMIVFNQYQMNGDGEEYTNMQIDTYTQ